MFLSYLNRKCDNWDGDWYVKKVEKQIRRLRTLMRTLVRRSCNINVNLNIYKIREEFYYWWVNWEVMMVSVPYPPIGVMGNALFSLIYYDLWIVCPNKVWAKSYWHDQWILWFCLSCYENQRGFEINLIRSIKCYCL